MSAEGGTKAVVAALAANLAIALTKFGAWLLTGASSMLAEAIHSVADSGNQVLLLGGGQKASRGQPVVAAGGRQEARASRHARAPVRVRPRALHLRVPRLHRAVQHRWC